MVRTRRAHALLEVATGGTAFTVIHHVLPVSPRTCELTLTDTIQQLTALVTASALRTRILVTSLLARALLLLFTLSLVVVHGLTCKTQNWLCCVQYLRKEHWGQEGG
jgi:hypothetical protein